MKIFILFFDNIINRPSYKFFLNMFFLKNNFYFNFKNLLFIHFFLNLRNTFNIKFLKFNYSLYKNFILYFFLLNILTQIYVLIVLL